MPHFLITGHTGFKGAWLTFMLRARGHEVSGLALDPLPGSIFCRCELQRELLNDFRVDVRNREQTIAAVQKARPDYVIHLAAQALVRDGYRAPLHTYDTNVTGTLNVLEAIDKADSVQGYLVVTSDKVYLNRGLKRPYLETDELGGKDPYSASKAMSDILSQEYLSRSDAKPGAIVRAGNVVGTGDIGVDRLIPDALAAIAAKRPLLVRNPSHVRPWQHVLDCLSGYLAVIDSLKTSAPTNIFNIGPALGGELSVHLVVEMISAHNGDLLVETVPTSSEWMEDSYLRIHSGRAHQLLGWSPRLSSTEAIQWALRGSGAAAKALPLSKEICLQIQEYSAKKQVVHARE